MQPSSSKHKLPRENKHDDARPARLVRRPERHEGTAVLGRPKLDTTPSAKTGSAAVQRGHTASPVAAGPIEPIQFAAASLEPVHFATGPAEHAELAAPAPNGSTSSVATARPAGRTAAKAMGNYDRAHRGHRAIGRSRHVGLQILRSRSQHLELIGADRSALRGCQHHELVDDGRTSSGTSSPDQLETPSGRCHNQRRGHIS
jgi:hypothetical protein